MAYKIRRQRRRYAMLWYGFLPFEASELSSVSSTEAPYLKNMIRFRKIMRVKFMEQAKANQWTKTQIETEWKKVIRQEYLDHNWVRKAAEKRVGMTSYKASPWEMLDYYRHQAIDAGEYFPRGKRTWRDKEGRVFHISKGDVQAQKERARQKRKQLDRSSSDFQKWQQQRAEQKKRARQRAKVGEH